MILRKSPVICYHWVNKPWHTHTHTCTPCCPASSCWLWLSGMLSASAGCESADRLVSLHPPPHPSLPPPPALLLPHTWDHQMNRFNYLTGYLGWGVSGFVSDGISSINCGARLTSTPHPQPAWVSTQAQAWLPPTRGSDRWGWAWGSLLLSVCTPGTGPT